MLKCDICPLTFLGEFLEQFASRPEIFSSLYVSSSFSLSVRASVVTVDAETLKVKGLFEVL